jgi:GNAT superfamily N-acetyltransferase
MSQISLRPMTDADWLDVAGLIYDSTNAWYVANGRSPIFGGPRDSTLLFCSVYEQLDPGCCVLAVDQSSGRVAGSCFYHPRSTHVSLGIMNVHPDFFGQGVARQMLSLITDFADERQLPVRLVSSAINLDSYSLYNRAGFVPRIVYQDMILQVPETGISDSSVDTSPVRQATTGDIDAIVALERELNHIERERDIRYFVENKDGIWHTTVHAVNDTIDGFLVSVFHPGSHMLGPGAARTASVINALILDQLNHHRGRQPVWLVPARQREVVDKMYSWGARNCELHFAQCRGEIPPSQGIVLPTFMPETG